jgi:hypothetical protein
MSTFDATGGGGGAKALICPGLRILFWTRRLRISFPTAAVFAAMLEGWSRQQQSRLLRPATIRARLDLMRRFAAFTNQYPWEWTPGEVEAFTSELISGASPRAASTVRAYELTVRLFCEFVTDARYGSPVECERRFGTVPSQICHEWNTVAHRVDYEGRPGRRALTLQGCDRPHARGDKLSFF